MSSRARVRTGRWLTAGKEDASVRLHGGVAALCVALDGHELGGLLKQVPHPTRRADGIAGAVDLEGEDVEDNEEHNGVQVVNNAVNNTRQS